jgi:hypothetical protein
MKANMRFGVTDRLQLQAVFANAFTLLFSRPFSTTKMEAMFNRNID